MPVGFAWWSPTDLPKRTPHIGRFKSKRKQAKYKKRGK